MASNEIDELTRDIIGKIISFKAMPKREYQVHLVNLEGDCYFDIFKITSDKFILITKKGFDVESIFNPDTKIEMKDGYGMIRMFDSEIVNERVFHVEIRATRKLGNKIPVLSYHIHGE